MDAACHVWGCRTLEKRMATPPVFLPGESQGQGSLLGCRLWGRTRLKQLSSMSIESVMPSKHLILCHPLLLLPSIFPSIRVPVHHQLPEFTQTHIHRVSNAIQPSNPLSSPSPPAPNPSQHQSLFQCPRQEKAGRDHTTSKVSIVKTSPQINEVKTTVRHPFTSKVAQKIRQSEHTQRGAC